MITEDPQYSRASLDAARATVGAVVAPTLQCRWPLLEQRLGAEVWVKHENHTALGAFKLRGGLTYFAAFFSNELPRGTTMVAGRPCRRAANAMDWP